MNFDPSYLEGEEREGFYIKPMMKKAWAAQLEILEQIDIICKRHNIMYYAEWGTLLGAIRHQGFIPWDDDLDIGMKREDYKRFLHYAKTELPEPFKINNVANNREHLELLTRVTNGNLISLESDFLERFHGCPYVVGIDIFPSDYIPTNKAEEELQLNLLRAVDVLGHEWNNENFTEEQKMELVREIEEVCNIKFTDDQPLMQQLLVLADNICAMYCGTDSDEITLLALLAQDPDYRLPITCYTSTIEVPFENTTIPVPIGYNQVLRRRYGDNYMTPVKVWNTHDYPFYKVQQKILFDYFETHNLSIPEELKE